LISSSGSNGKAINASPKEIDPRFENEHIFIWPVNQLRSNVMTITKKSYLSVLPIVAILLVIGPIYGFCEQKVTVKKKKPAIVLSEGRKSKDDLILWTPRNVHTAIKFGNPEYNGTAQFQIRQGRVLALQLTGTGVSDLSPLKEMGIMVLDLRGLPVTDLGPLEGLQLRELYLEDTGITDLEPLRGMPLVRLYLSNTALKDLAPLQGTPLKTLNLFGTPVKDLIPLKGMPLQYLWLNGTPVSDISPLTKCPLVSLTLHQTRVEDLSPLAGSNLQRLHMGETPATDLTPLRGLSLTRLIFTPGRITKGIDIIRKMPSIREIGPTLKNKMNPDKFWGLYDSGKFHRSDDK
jgi:hypothetical protein